MANSKKRRLSMSPTRSSQPDDSPEQKKRKTNTSVPPSPAPVEPISAGGPETRSPEPSASDSSATLEGDAPLPPSQDKGKGVEKDPLVLERLQKEEVAQKDKLPEKHDKVTEVKKLLACNICAEPLYKPYVLIPCGHVTCYVCLVLWFTSSHNDRHGDENNPDLDWNSMGDHSDTGSSDSEPPDFGDNPSQLKGESNRKSSNAKRLRHYRFPNCVGRDKTCPECRNLVVDRPVFLYVLRDLVDVACGGRTVAKKKKDRDPWKGIFRPRPPPGPGPGGNGGGPSGGGGGGHLRRNDDDNDGAPSDVEVLDGPSRPALDGSARRRRDNPSTLGLPSGYDEGLPGPSYIEHRRREAPPRPVHVDREDNVRRCGECLHELWHGECTNDECGIVYGEPSPANSEAGSSEHIHDDDEEGDIFFEPMGDEHYIIDDGYDSSFIDDEDDRSRHYAESEYYLAPDSEEGGSDNDDFITGPSQRWQGRRRPIAISFDDDNQPGPSRLVRPRRGRQIVDDEELEVEEDVSVEDGSNPSRLNVAITGAGSRSPTTPAETHPVIEDNDYAENYADVPYAWEQENDGDDEEEPNPDDGGDDS